MRLLRAAYDFLRRRRPAIWLILGISTYAVVVTLIPQTATEAEQYARWPIDHPVLARITQALGLHEAWTHPVFLLPAFWLVLSTVACSWERTSMAVRRVRQWRRIAAGGVIPKPSRDAICVVTDLDRAEVTSALVALATARRMRPVESSQGVWATSRVFGAVGSPLFHWALALLFVFAALGQASKAEGLVGIVVGHTVPDAQASYGRVSTGFLRPTIGSDLEFSVSHLRTRTIVGGVDRGPSARVIVRKPNGQETSRWVYPNHLLKMGSLLIHRDELGLGAVLRLYGADGTDLGQTQVLFDYADADLKTGRIIAERSMQRTSGEPQRVIVTMRLDKGPDGIFLKRPPKDRSVLVEFPRASGETSAGTAVSVGESIGLPDGSGRIGVELVDYYARLLVVKDWTIPWLYAWFTLAVLGASLALLLPPRAFYAHIEDGERGTIVRLSTKCQRIDIGYAAAISEEIAHAVSGRLLKEGETPWS